MTLSGPEHELARFRSHCIRVRSTEDDETASLDFDALVPMPKEIVATLDDNPSQTVKDAALAATGYTDWYDWRRAKWGVKWNANAYDEIRVSPGVHDVLFATAWSTPGLVLQAIAEQFPALKGTVFAVEEDEQFGLAGLIADGAYTGIEMPISTELRFITRESTYSESICSVSSLALAELHSEQEHPFNATNHETDGQTRVQQAWTAICSKLPAGFERRYEFRTDLEGYHDWLSDPSDSVECHVRSASHRSFFENEGRFQTEADQRLMRLIGHALESEIRWPGESLDPKIWSPVACLLATRLGDEVLCEWAAHAMYRAGVVVDLTTAETRQASFAVYGIMMGRRVLEYLAGQP